MKALKLLKLEIWKAKFYLVCELPARWKSSQTQSSFDKSEGFWTLCSFKILKMQTLLIFSHAPLVKTIQIHFLTKVRAWTIRKLRRWSQFVPITFLNQHCQTIFFKLMSTLLKNPSHALYRAAPSGARLARPYCNIDILFSHFALKKWYESRGARIW